MNRVDPQRHTIVGLVAVFIDSEDGEQDGDLNGDSPPVQRLGIIRGFFGDRAGAEVSVRYLSVLQEK
jgi:hypothetical protein